VQQKSTGVEATGTPEHPAFPHAMVLTVSFVLSLVTGLVCHHRLADLGVSGPTGPTSHPAKLDASVGASGPHDFAVHVSAVRQRRHRVHRIPSRVRDDRDTPLMWDGMAGIMEVIWVGREGKYFWRWDWTGRNSLIRLNKSG
jgi:hypothetical protein